ncbi:hypothetical protein, partial [Bacteroides sp. AF25-17LB]|uniref:hypothetical protein n=1 Tax=Bacteroides sp. AF25-17LB TaxID=2292922 RepID=UPI001A9E110E
AVQASACAGRNAEDEIFYGRADIQNSFEIINEKISGGMFDTIRHPFFLYYICKINGGIQILIVIL